MAITPEPLSCRRCNFLLTLREAEAKCSVSGKILHPCCGISDVWHFRCVASQSWAVHLMLCMIMQKAREDAWSQKEKSLAVCNFGGPVGKEICCVVAMRLYLLLPLISLFLYSETAECKLQCLGRHPLQAGVRRCLGVALLRCLIPRGGRKRRLHSRS